MTTPVLTRRKVCPTCQKRVTMHIYPNAAHIPACGCMGFFLGTPPFRELTLAEQSGLSPDTQLEYLLFGPGPEDITDTL